MIFSNPDQHVKLVQLYLIRNMRCAMINMCRSYSTSGPVSSWMGDCLRVSEPSGYATNQSARLNQLSTPNPDASAQ